MRTWRGLAYASLPEASDEQFLPRIRDSLAEIDYYLSDLNRGVQRIEKGQVPSGSGASIPVGSLGSLLDYFFLPGRPKDQIGYGGTLASGNLTLGSTSNATKGKIILGTSAYDEANVRFGIGTLAPAAKLEIHQTGTNVPYGPNSTIAGSPQWSGQDAGASLHTYVNELVANDATYITDNTNLGVSVRVGLPNITPQLTTATIQCSFRIGWIGTNGGAVGINNLNLTLRDGSAGTPTVHTMTQNTFVASGAHGNVAFTTFTFTLTPTEIQTIITNSGWNGMSMEISSGGGGGGYAGALQCSWMQLAIVGGAAVPLVDLYNLSDVLSFRIDQNGRYDADAAGALTISGIFDNSTPFLKYMDTGSGFTTSVVGIVLTADRTVSFPDGSGEILLGNATQNVQNKTFTNGNSKFNVNTTGPQFRNGASTTQLMTWDLTALTTSRIKAWSDMPALMGSIGNGADPPAAGAMGKVNRTAQAAAVAATNLTNTTPAGYYVVHYTLEDTATDVTAGTIQFQISYTDDIGATTQTGANLALTATGRDRGSFEVYLASGNITYQTNLTGIIGTARYALRVRVEFLG